jgi:hypothetical protein
MLSLMACGSEADEPDQELRTYFEGAEIADDLANDPNASFFVDLRTEDVYTFDQDDHSIDFAYFTVQCPSMARPMPMPDFAALLGLDLEEPYWTMQSPQPFRQAVDDCVIVCPRSGGECWLECPQTPQEQ